MPNSNLPLFFTPALCGGENIAKNITKNQSVRFKQLSFTDFYIFEGAESVFAFIFHVIMSPSCGVEIVLQAVQNCAFDCPPAQTLISPKLFESMRIKITNDSNHESKSFYKSI